MEEWKKYLGDGLAYCKTVLGARVKKKNFGNAVLYNLIGLSIESLLMALLLRDRQLPEHSSIVTMLNMLRKNYEMPESFKTESRFYNQFMNFCSLDIMENVDPTDPELERMIAFLVNIREWVNQQIQKTPVQLID